MIARLWRGVTPAPRAAAYLAYVRRTGIRACRATPGNRGVFVLRRPIRGGAFTEFTFISLWASAAAVRRFAGPKPERPVYFPADRRFLVHLAPRVRHHEVVARRTPRATRLRARPRRPRPASRPRRG